MKVYFTDEDNEFQAVIVIFFYNKSYYLINLLKERNLAYIYAKFKYQYNELQTSQFEIIEVGSSEEELENKVKDSSEMNKIIPVYSLSKFFNQKKFREIIVKALEYLKQLKLENILPAWITSKYGFFSRKILIEQMHFPTSYDFLKKAINQYKYYEFFRLIFLIQCKKEEMKKKIKEKKKDKYKKGYELWISKAKKKVGFQLTKEQEKVFLEIETDLLQISPMYRLLQGDVATGKTIVALLSSIIPIFSGYQVALMVPTEILAYQHYQTFQKILNDLPIKIAILVSSMKNSEKKEIINELKNGEISVIIGTHSLFGEKIEYKNLSMVIIDEQHRFGVDQRVRMIQKSYEVDILAMTATPIPRTFALTLYGDLSLSFLRKKPIEVKIYSECVFTKEERKQVYNRLKKEVEKGRQGYIICPRIKDTETVNMSSIFSLKKELEGSILKECRIELFYSEQSLEEKKNIMDEYIKGKVDILIATTIIEVGVDVQNANMMIIENAERFGLAQLHQLRGRIGRGSHDSYCIFIAEDSLTENGKKRLEGLLQHQDGFKLSEIDLKIRGPGEFFGYRQSGEDIFQFADLIEDKNFLYQAYEDVRKILDEDPSLNKEENRNLKKLYKYLENRYFTHLVS